MAETVKSVLVTASDQQQIAAQLVGSIVNPAPLVVFTTAWTLSGTVPSITLSDNQGGTWNKGAEIKDATTSQVNTIWYRASSSTTAPVVTAVSDQADTWWAMTVAEINDSWRASKLFGSDDARAGTSDTISVTINTPTILSRWLNLAQASHDNVAGNSEAFTWLPPWLLIAQTGVVNEGLPQSCLELAAAGGSNTATWDPLPLSSGVVDWVATGIALLPNEHIRDGNHRTANSEHAGSTIVSSRATGYHFLSPGDHAGSTAFLGSPTVTGTHLLQSADHNGSAIAVSISKAEGLHFLSPGDHVGVAIKTVTGPFIGQGDHLFQASDHNGMAVAVGVGESAQAQHDLQSSDFLGQALHFDKPNINGATHTLQPSDHLGQAVSGTAFTANAEHDFQPADHVGVAEFLPVASLTAGHIFQSSDHDGSTFAVAVATLTAEHIFQSSDHDGRTVSFGVPSLTAEHIFQPPDHLGSAVSNPIVDIPIRGDCLALGVARISTVMSTRRIELCEDFAACPQPCVDADLTDGEDFLASVPVDPNALPTAAEAVFSRQDSADSISQDCTTAPDKATCVLVSLGPDGSDPTKWVSSPLRLERGWWNFTVRYTFAGSIRGGPARSLYVSRQLCPVAVP